MLPAARSSIVIPNCAHALFADIVSPFVVHGDELTRDTTFGLHKQVDGAKPAMKQCKQNICTV
jgi:hypothetical protein